MLRKRRSVTGASFGAGNYLPSQIELKRQELRTKKNRKSRAIAAISSLLVLGTLALIVVLSPGFRTLRDTFFNWANHSLFFSHLLSSYRTTKKRSQRYSNSDLRSSRRECWPLDHQHHNTWFLGLIAQLLQLLVFKWVIMGTVTAS